MTSTICFMTNNQSSVKTRKFAYKYKFKWLGWAIIFYAIFGFPSLVDSLLDVSTTAGAFFAFFGIVFLIALGIYFLRGVELSPAQIARAQRKADKLQAEIDRLKKKLSSAAGGQLVVEYRNLENLLNSTKLPNSRERFEEILDEISFDKSKIQSVEIGVIPKISFLNNHPIEIYKDWIIWGQTAYDVDSSTRGEVHVDGSIQIDAKNKKHDMRTANIQFVSTGWSHSFRIGPDQANDARRLVAQLAAITDSLKPSSVTTEDIAKMIDTILSNTGQSPAEKLQQLSDLRYQRLLSDQEYEAAKAKILGI